MGARPLVQRAAEFKCSTKWLDSCFLWDFIMSTKIFWMESIWPQMFLSSQVNLSRCQAMAPWIWSLAWSGSRGFHGFHVVRFFSSEGQKLRVDGFRGINNALEFVQHFWRNPSEYENMKYLKYMRQDLILESIFHKHPFLVEQWLAEFGKLFYLDGGDQPWGRS